VIGYAVLIIACCGVATPRASEAEELRELASSADWQLVMAEDPFADPPTQCQIRTRTANSGGRRERPLIIFDVTSHRITVRPDMALQGSVQANRRLQGDTGDQGGQHQVAVRHGIRVDSGKLYTLETRDLGSNTMEIQFDSATYDGISAAAREGTTLTYLWQIETSRRAFQFPLDGVRVLLPKARESCAAPAR
jgi:hypothetical protein